MEKTRISDQSRELVSEEILRVAEKLKNIRRDADEACRTEKAWKDLKKYLELGWPHHVINLINKESNIFDAGKVANPLIGRALDEISAVVKESAINVQRRFPWLIETECKEVGLPIDLGSRHPRYSFMTNFFQLEIDESRWIAKLSDYEGKLAEVLADVGAVISVVQREHNRVFNRPFDSMKFLGKVRRQYLAILKKHHSKDGDIVPIRQITHRLGKNIKGFRTDEFLVDLSRLIELGESKIDGRKIDLQQTKDIDQGMLLYGAAGRGYVGFVTFREG
jgi:hypothetical protein